MPVRDGAWPNGTPCWIDCQVDDTAAAREFYTRLFGWEVYDSPEEAGGYLMAYKNDKAVAGIGPKPENMPMPSTWTTYLAADSADDTAARITTAGGQVMMPPFDVLDVGRMFVAADPTGGRFGVWQAGTHAGAAVYNEHGAYCWNELHTRDYAAAQAFYSAVFGWTFEEIGDGVSMTYSTFTNAGAGAGVGGMADDSGMPGEGAYWLTWFQVDDVDASATQAADLGSAVMMGPDTTPFGRMSVVAGPQGEVFGLIDPTTTTTESAPPAPTD